MEVTVDVVDLVSKLMDSGNYKDALSVPNDEKYVQVFKDNSSDLISVIVQKVQDDTILVKPSLLGACEEMLALIIQKSTPEEALLEFIEQIELAKNDAQFGIILTPLQKLLKKLTNKRGRSLEWCLNSISTYIEKIPIPEHKLEGKERLLLDSDPGIRRIAKVYSLLPHFYSTFIKELSKPDSNLRYKQIIAAFLISLLGKPLIYVDMDPEINAQSEARQSCTIIISDICILEKNLLKFLEWLEHCNNQQGKSKSSETMNTNEEERSPYEHDDKINMTSLSGFFYSIFSGHFEFEKNGIPQVYSIEYIVNTTMLAVLHLLSFSEYSPICKGMSLCKALLDRLPDQTPHKLLSASVHFNLCRSLMNITIYSEYDSVRKQGLQLLSCHLNKFDYKGRCRLIQFLVKNANHSGLIGYVITQYKNSIDEGFKEPILPDCFTGAQLMSMIDLFCYLPFGAESDLVELADQIISTLNILRYLALKDTQNITGIKDNFTKIESEYLDKIRTGLNMSKAHYEEKLKEIDDAREGTEDVSKISLNVGGNVLDQIPKEKKKEIVLFSLNAFHLIQGLVGRVSECFNIK